MFIRSITEDTKDAKLSNVFNALRDVLDIFHVFITNVECTSHTSLYTNTYLIIQILIILKFLGHCASRMESAKPGLTSAS